MAKFIPSDKSIYFLAEWQHLQELTDFTEELAACVPPEGEKTKRPWECWATLRKLKFELTDVVLDVGAQPSFIDAWIAKKVHSVLAVDNKQFEYMHRMERLTFEEWSALLIAKAPNIKTRPMDGTDLGLPDNSFDVVISFSVLEHMIPGQDSQASAEAYRVLKPGGFFAGTVDFGVPEEGVRYCERYSKDTFRERIVNAAPWKWVAEAPDTIPTPGVRSAMVFVLEK